MIKLKYVHAGEAVSRMPSGEDPNDILGQAWALGFKKSDVAIARAAYFNEAIDFLVKTAPGKYSLS